MPADPEPTPPADATARPDPNRLADLLDCFPPPAGAREVHERAYLVRGYTTESGELLLRGVLRDVKPPHLYIRADPDPLAIHQMVVDVRMTIETLEITDVDVVFETHPHATCPTIAAAYQGLIGASVARGYNRRVAELFGGPRGCSHVTALLTAMGPVAIQSRYASTRALDDAASDRPDSGRESPSRDELDARRLESYRRSNVGSCHLWAEDGPLVRLTEPAVPIPIAVRMRRFGLEPADWRRAR